MPEFFFTRHSKAKYDEYGKILSGDDPRAPFDHTKQESTDLTPEGIKLANEKAILFFDNLDPKEDQIFLVSSNEARAIGTASIYRQVAISKGFEVIKPEHSRSPLSDKETEGDARVLNALSLNTEDTLQFLVFSSSEPNVNWQAVDPEFKQKWQTARQMIEAENKGTWGNNFAAYSHKIKEIFPEIETAKTFYETNFKNLLTLMKWADKKIQKSGKKVKVLAFGHEDYIVKFLHDEFGQEGIQNCETIAFNVDEGNIEATVGSKTKQLD